MINKTNFEPLSHPFVSLLSQPDPPISDPSLLEPSPPEFV